MAAVKRLIVADAHVGQRSGDSADMISMLYAAGDCGVMEIIFLGDGFQYLIGMSKFWTRGVIEVLEAWRRLRQAGVRIGVVEGNRDFFLDAARQIIRHLLAPGDWQSDTKHGEHAGANEVLSNGHGLLTHPLRC